ncbi:MAG: maltose alpha-D-glucosyltransferase [Desulfatiglandales bacterium]
MPADDPRWYKDAIIYQLHVKAFCDGEGDGLGDFNGLTGKLDYLQDLGVTALWLLPFCPSPLKDDGYDISDYRGIHPAYGSLRDFKAFLREAHKRGLRVITELVINHTSDQHPWFRRARLAGPASTWRNFYVWSETPERYQEARIIFQDFESSNWAWDPAAGAYYWHRFYVHQPDLNFDNPNVRKAILKVLEFWFGLGVDGLRLDAVPYLFEREGTNCENLPETHEFLKEMRDHVDARFENRMLLGEANQWPEDAVAYFGEGDECHMAFHFPLMPRLFMALHMEDRFPIIDILEQTPAIPEICQWAVFLRNHDELTLEMVTDEERDYMYRVYAQDPQMRINLGIRRRLAPLLENNRRRIELMTCLLFSMPGTPVIYYGDELGMGDNIYLGDRNGVRTPMQWSPDRNAGFSRANPQKLYLPVIIDPEYHYEVINVDAQLKNFSSLLWWNKRLISLRKRIQAFSRGDIRFLQPENIRILAFVRSYRDEHILVLANLSRFVQYTELDLSSYRGRVPTEVFGQTPFPAITEAPFPFTMGPHSFYWLHLAPSPDSLVELKGRETTGGFPVLEVKGRWTLIFKKPAGSRMEAILPQYLQSKRWFGGKGRTVKSVKIRETLSLGGGDRPGLVMVLSVAYVEGGDEAYLLPVSYGSGQEANRVREAHPEAVIARCILKDTGEEGLLYDAFAGPEFCIDLLESLLHRPRKKNIHGEITASLSGPDRKALRAMEALPEPSVLKAEQSNTSVVYGDRYMLKFFRRLQPGVNPDLEMGRYLTRTGFEHTPVVAGSLEYNPGREPPMTMAVLTQYIPNQGDAWTYTLNQLNRFFEHVLTTEAWNDLEVPKEGIFHRTVEQPPEEVRNLIGAYLDSIRLLGRRTGELHHALAAATDDPGFVPEPFTKLYRRSLYQSMRSLTGKVFRILRRRLHTLTGETAGRVEELLDHQNDIVDVFHTLLDHPVTAARIRCHGDYHLGQVLFTGKDFFIIDFEGEPARPITERRIKRCSLRDVAGMLRSFHYAAYSSLFAHETRGYVEREQYPRLEKMVKLWHTWVCSAFIGAYLETTGTGSFLPESEEEFRNLLSSYLMEKAVYELGYELNNRPDWIDIPVQGIRELLGIT